MFKLFKSDPTKKLEKQYARKLEDARDAQRAGKIPEFAAKTNEAEAVRETVQVLKQADLVPLDVTGYGTLQDREAEGHEINDHQRALMQRALEENAVIVAESTVLTEEDT